MFTIGSFSPVIGVRIDYVSNIHITNYNRDKML